MAHRQNKGNSNVKSSTEKDSFSESGEESERDNIGIKDFEAFEQDEDDSPVAISWQQSKDVYKKNEEQRKEAVNFLKSKSKEKRRRKNELFVVQKQTKTSKMAFELTRLPEEIVDQAAVAIENKKARMETEVEKNTGKEPKKVKKMKNKKLKREKKIDEDEDEEYCNVVVNSEVKKSKKVQQSATDFLKNHLYGDRIQRTSTSSNMSLQCKRSRSMKPALKFSC